MILIIGLLITLPLVVIAVWDLILDIKIKKEVLGVLIKFNEIFHY